MVEIRGQGEDADLGKEVPDRGDDALPSPAGHVYVDQDHIGPLQDRERYRVVHMESGAHHAHPALVLEKVDESGENMWVVIHDKNSNGFSVSLRISFPHVNETRIREGAESAYRRSIFSCIN